MAITVREIDGRKWKWCDGCHRYEGTHKCKWCGKKYKSPKGLSDHEKICFLNPKREPCPHCKGHGGRWQTVYDSTTFAQVDADWIECHACKDMEERRTLEWWAKYGDEVPEEERRYTCEEASGQIARGEPW